MPSLSYGDADVVNYNTSQILNSFNTSVLNENVNKFGIYPDTFYKSLYKMYPTISTCVYRIMEYALGLTHDLYKKWLDYKSNPKLNYEKNISKLSNNYFSPNAADNKLSTSFSYFIDLFLASSSFSDPSLIFNRKEYLEKVFTLNKELIDEHYNEFDDSNIYVNVGCTHNEFPMIKDNLKTFSNISNINSLAFSIVPSLISIQPAANNSVSEALVEIREDIAIDINRMICLFCKIYDPSSLPEFLNDGEQNKDVYIKNGLDVYKDLPDKLTKAILLELFDNYNNAYANWGQFVNKLDKHYKQALSDKDIEIFTRKLSHYQITELDNIIFSLSTSKRMFEDDTKINMNSYNDLLSSLYTAWVELDNNSRPIDEIGKAFICKLFTKAFSSSVMYQIYVIDKKLLFTQYTKEFYQKYSKNELLEESVKISDYNIKDFFQSIIKDFKSEPYKPYGQKLRNGEYAYFMYSKSLKNIWFDFCCTFYIVLNLSSMVKKCEKTIPNSFNLTMSLNAELNTYLNGMMRCLSDICLLDGTSLCVKFFSNSDHIFERIISLYNLITRSDTNSYRYGSLQFDDCFQICSMDSNIKQDLSIFDTTYLKTDETSENKDSDFICDTINNIKNILISEGVIPIAIGN